MGATPTRQTVNWIEKACRYIETHLEEDVSLSALSKVVHVSAPHLQRTFKKSLGVTPKEYAEKCRVERLKSKIKSRKTVTEAMVEAGFGSSSRLYENHAKLLGMTPGEYRRRGKGMSIRFCCDACHLGRVLVAGTNQGVCAVNLGDDDAFLESELRRDFCNAQIERDDAVLGVWLEEVLRYLRGQTPSMELPLDVQATAFQRRVWQELLAIPAGLTRSYSEVARRIGAPTSARAVARACATNPVSIIIPCHRVVREDGGLGGYRWGLSRKEQLLSDESERDNRETE